MVEAATKDIDGDVEYELVLEMPEAVLRANVSNPRTGATSIYWFFDSDGQTKDEINAMLAAIRPHAQAMVDAFAAIENIVYPPDEVAS